MLYELILINEIEQRAKINFLSVAVYKIYDWWMDLPDKLHVSFMYSQNDLVS